jgi:hypothetical protein
MTLNCTPVSHAKKTFGLAVTYRAGVGEMFGTCPDSCALKPAPTSTTKIDRAYERAVRRAVPKKGQSFLYTHFKPYQWGEKNGPGKTVFNFSADKIAQAATYVKKGIATVTVVPADYWKDKTRASHTIIDGALFVRCVNEVNKKIGCAKCGNGSPLCARFNRAFGVVFTAHGAGKIKAGDSSEAGGCYAGFDKVAIHWRNLAKRKRESESDGEKIKRFAAGLPPYSILRSHIAGDLGKVL